MTERFHRRKLLKRAAALAGAAAGTRLLGVPSLLAGPSPNSTLRTVVIGCANQGIASVNAAVTERLVALVDVDENHLAKTMKWIEERAPDVKPSSIKIFYDYRKMFDEIRDQIDAVFVATPDHNHAPASMIAIKLGKGVYVEKPLAHSVDEVRRLTEAAKKHNAITQMGNQGHSGEGIRRLCEYIWAGAIGNVVETHSWAPTGRGGVGGRLPTKPVPQGLHWDEWIGPAPYRDYHEELHPQLWRSWWDFGDGSVGDWGCHNLDGSFMALKLGAPTSVEAVEQYGGSDERFPLRNTIRWDFPARGDAPPVKVFWYDGYANDFDPARKDDEPEAALKAQNRPPIVAELEKKYGRNLRNGGTIYVGGKGIMYTGNYAGSPRILPEEKHRAFPVPPKTLPRVRGTHQDDFLRACKDGQPACSNFSYSGPLSEMVLLGCLAIKAGPGKKVEWDAAGMKCTNLPELNRLVKREYREGWTL
jgi:predicted dehydrogenase